MVDWVSMRSQTGVSSVSASNLLALWGSSVVLDLSLLICEMGPASLLTWEAAESTANLFPNHQHPAVSGVQELFSDDEMMGK